MCASMYINDGVCVVIRLNESTNGAEQVARATNIPLLFDFIVAKLLSGISSLEYICVIPQWNLSDYTLRKEKRISCTNGWKKEIKKSNNNNVQNVWEWKISYEMGNREWDTMNEKTHFGERDSNVTTITSTKKQTNDAIYKENEAHNFGKQLQFD